MPGTSASPPTERVLAVLELLASDPAREFKLADVVAALGITKATAHAILQTLAVHGHLVRNPVSRGFSLGPGALLIGRAAERSNPALAVARGVVPLTAAELQMECVASVIDEDVITVVEWCAAPGADTSERPWSHLGQRVPLVPPFGAAPIAWSNDDRIERWVGHAEPAGRDRLRELLASVRRRRFDVQLDDSNVAAFRTSLAGLDIGRLSSAGRAAITQLVAELGAVDVPPEQLDARRHHVVNALAAPVFGFDRRPVLTLSVHPRAPLTGRAATAAGRRLRELADRITEASGGAQPD